MCGCAAGALVEVHIGLQALALPIVRATLTFHTGEILNDQRRSVALCLFIVRSDLTMKG